MADYIGRLAVKLSADSSEFSTAMGKAASQTAATGKVLDDATKATAANAATQRQAAQVVESVKTPMERHAERLQRLNRLLQQGAIDQETYNKAVSKSERRADKEESGSESRFMRRIGHLAGSLAIVEAGVVATEALIAGVKADSAIAIATAQGSAVGILKAQQQAIEAHEEIAGKIPIIGGAIKSVMGVWSDKGPIESAIRNIEELNKKVVESAAWRKQVERETAVTVAEAEGKSAADIAAIKKGFAAEDRKAKLDELTQTSRGLAQQIADAENNPQRQKLQSYLDQQRAYGGDTSRLRKAQDELDSYNAVAIDLSRKRAAVDADIAAVKKAGEQTAKAEGVKTERERLQESFANQSAITAFTQTETDKRVTALWNEANIAIAAAEKEGKDITDIFNAATQREADIRKAAYDQTEGGKRAQEIERVTKALQDQAAVAGMTAQQVELYKLKSLGASDAQIALAQSMQDQIAASKTDAEWKSKAEAILKSIESPQEKYKKQVAELNTLFDAGELSQAQYDKALEAIGGKKAKGGKETTGAMEFGTAQAYTVALSNPMESTAKGVWTIADSGKRQERLLQKIADKNNNLEVVSIG